MGSNAPRCRSRGGVAAKQAVRSSLKRGATHAQASQGHSAQGGTTGTQQAQRTTIGTGVCVTRSSMRSAPAWPSSSTTTLCASSGHSTVSPEPTCAEAGMSASEDEERVERARKQRRACICTTAARAPHRKRTAHARDRGGHSTVQGEEDSGTKRGQLTSVRHSGLKVLSASVNTCTSETQHSRDESSVAGRRALE